MGFDERVRERKKMLRAKEEADLLAARAEAAKAALEALRLEVRLLKRFPAMLYNSLMKSMQKGASLNFHSFNLKKM
jgi:hypothetical protein